MEQLFLSRKNHNASLGLRWLTRLLIGLALLSVIFPLVWYFYTSFKTSAEYLNDFWSWPKSFDFQNYRDAFHNTAMFDYEGNIVTVITLLKNTLFTSLLGTFLLLIMSSSTAFILAKYHFFGHRFFSLFYFVAMVIPSILLVVPLHTQLTAISSWFTNNLLVVAIIYAVQALPVQIFLLTRFIEGIDDGLIEAARIDGANEFYIFFRIIIPCITPILLFVALTSFMAFWNEYTIALLFLDDPSKYTLSIGLEQMKLAAEVQSNYGVVFAGLMTATLPILAIYFLVQKPLLNGVDMSSAVKG